MIDIKKRHSFNIEYKSLVFIIFSLFIFNETPRMCLFSKAPNVLSKLSTLNILFLFSSFMLFIQCLKRKRIQYVVVFLTLLFSSIILLNNISIHKELGNLVFILTCYSLSFLLISMELNKRLTLKIYNKFLNIFNIAIYILLILGIIDYLTNGLIQIYLANNWAYNEEFSDLIFTEHYGGIYRYYSIFGHPLHNSKLFLSFFALNNIYNKYYLMQKINEYLLVVITIIGLVLCGGKAGLILGAFLILFTSNIKKNKWLFYGVLLALFIILFNTELFRNNILQRFADGIENNDLSSGRNSAIYAWILGGYERPGILFGGGSGYSRLITKVISYGALNFEYPFIMLPFDYGIIPTIIIYLIIFAYPIYTFIKNKSYFIMINYTALFLYVNSNNGLANLYDSMPQFCFITMILINTSKALIKDRIFLK